MMMPETYPVTALTAKVDICLASPINLETACNVLDFAPLLMQV